jgi:hypothetical protein
MKNDSKLYICISAISLAIILFVAACEKRPFEPDDGEISTHIQGKFGIDSGLHSKLLSVQSHQCVVTLSGSVDNEAQRNAAVRYASSEPGVKQVVDLLSVRLAPAEAPSTQPEEKALPAARPHGRQKVQTPLSAAGDPEEDPVAPEVFAEPTVAAEGRDLIPDSSRPQSPKVAIPAGTNFSVRLIDTIDSETAAPGQMFEATLESPLSFEGDVVVPRGHTVQGHVVEVKSAGKFAGRSELTVALDRLVVGNKTYSLQTDQFHRAGSSRGKDTATKVGAGAVLGAVLGGIAGGGKGAAIGAAAGGGVGGGVQASGRGQQIVLGSESTLSFTLQAPLTVLPTTESASLIPRPPVSTSDGCAVRDSRGKRCAQGKCEIDCDKRPHEKILCCGHDSDDAERRAGFD